MVDPILVVLTTVLCAVILALAFYRFWKSWLRHHSRFFRQETSPPLEPVEPPVAPPSCRLNPGGPTSFGTLLVFVGSSEEDERPEAKEHHEGKQGLKQHTRGDGDKPWLLAADRGHQITQLSTGVDAGLHKETRSAEVREAQTSPSGATPRSVPEWECAVCLSEFQKGELLRRLHLCGHFFHKVQQSFGSAAALNYPIQSTKHNNESFFILDDFLFSCVCAKEPFTVQGAGSAG